MQMPSLSQMSEAALSSVIFSADGQNFIQVLHFKRRSRLQIRLRCTFSSLFLARFMFRGHFGCLELLQVWF